MSVHMPCMRTCAAAARMDVLLPVPLAPLPGGRPRFLPRPGACGGLGGCGSRGAFGCFIGLGGLGGRAAMGGAGRHLDAVDLAVGMIQAGSGRGAPGSSASGCKAPHDSHLADCTATTTLKNKQRLQQV